MKKVTRSVGPACYDDIIKSLPSGIIVTNAQGIIVTINEKAEKLLGLKTGRFAGKTISDLEKQAGISNLLSGNNNEVVREKDGRKLLISVSPFHSKEKV